MTLGGSYVFNVAVILNESETERYGWANILPVLKRATERHAYNFHAYTASNFEEFVRRINNYDSVFISTNACNDELLFAKLVASKEAIAEFLARGKGLFASLQKRLIDVGSVTGFLPDVYEYRTIGRSEPSSAGDISVAVDGTESLLLSYPKRITIDRILDRCRHNHFKHHLYRGHIAPVNEYNYTSILVDSSYGDVRRLLLCSRFDFDARLVISTVPLDWEGHVDFLTNIILFVTEGQPLAAFVRKHGSETIDYEYLVSCATYHRIRGRSYDVETLDDPIIRTDVHKFHVLDPGWSEEEATKYWKRVSAAESDHDCRVYSFKRHGDVPSLVEHSKHSFSDGLIREAIAWLSARFHEGRFQGSFWITRDVLELYVSLSLPVDSIRDDILQRARQHDVNGSYDSLMGSTCALIEVYAWLLGTESDEYRRSLQWINENLEHAAVYDQQSALLTLHSLGESYDESTYRRLYNRLNDIPQERRAEMSELDLCRNARFCLLGNHDSAWEWVRVVNDAQSADGKWTNGARTATTVLFLLSVRDGIPTSRRELDSRIGRGVSFLAAEFNRDGACWYGDVLSTARATLALKTFQRLLEYPVEEAFLSIQRQQVLTTTARSATYATEAIDGIRSELATAKRRLRQSEQQITHYQKMRPQLERSRTALLFVVVALSALMVYLIHSERHVEVMTLLQAFVKDLSITIPAVIVFAIGTWLHVTFIRLAEKKSATESEPLSSDE